MHKVFLIIIILFSSIQYYTQNDTIQVDYFSKKKQNQEKTPFKDKLFFNGGITANFGSYTVLGANPSVGYKITDNFSAGLGGSIFYSKVNGFKPYTFYGGNVFSKYIIFESLYLQTEYHMMNVENTITGVATPLGERLTIPMWYIGGGYRQKIGNNTFAFLQVMWDVIDRPESPYINPNIGGGFSIGL